jgi:hypothetical protein
MVVPSRSARVPENGAGVLWRPQVSHGGRRRPMAKQTIFLTSSRRGLIGFDGLWEQPLLASCDGRSEQEPGISTTEIVPAFPQAVIEPTPDSWKACETPTFNRFGNKWWSGLTACEGDVLIDIEADSVLLHGPALRVTILTRSCPAGRGAGGKAFDDALFERPFEAQLREFKTVVRRLLSEIDAECGGPTKVRGLLGRKFDEAFLDLASRWLELSAEDRRKGS